MHNKAVWYLAGLLTLALVLSVAACGGSTTTPATPAAPTPAAPATPAVTPPAPAAPVTPPAATTPAAPAKPVATTPGVPPKIPHTLDGRDNCLACHSQGADGVGVVGGTGLPANHVGRTIDICKGCHVQG